MSLDNIQLGSYLTQQLYRKTLVCIDKHTAEKTPASSNQIAYLGKNEKSVLILVNEEESVYVHDNDLALLVGILNACNLSLADVAIVNHHKTPSAYNELISSFSPVFIFLLGVSPTLLDFPLHFPEFQLQHYNHQTYLAAPSLAQLAKDTKQKKQLWTCLQKHFRKA